MDKAIEGYIEYSERILEIYSKYNLFDLHTVRPDSEHLLTTLTKVTRKKIRRKDLYDFKFFDDLYFISRDLKYCTANLFFLRPHINNAEKEDGRFFKNTWDARYMMFVNFCHQLTYNYYDKIGDLLDSFFDTGLNEKVYFNRVIHNFPKPHREHPEFKWFENLLDTDLKDLNSVRDEIVHFTHLETKNFYQVMEAKFDIIKIKEIQKIKNSYPEEFQNILNICLASFSNAISLIDKLPDVTIGTAIK